jgi:hypothetical protein
MDATVASLIVSGLTLISQIIIHLKFKHCEADCGSSDQSFDSSLSDFLDIVTDLQELVPEEEENATRETN